MAQPAPPHLLETPGLPTENTHLALSHIVQNVLASHGFVLADWQVTRMPDRDVVAFVIPRTSPIVLPSKPST
jgi:hypothetical protein